MKTAQLLMFLMFTVLIIDQGILLKRVQRQRDELIDIAKDAQHLARQWETNSNRSIQAALDCFETAARLVSVASNHMATAHGVKP